MTEHPHTESSSAPRTGDEEVDATLRALDEALTDEDPAAAAAALSEAHRSLQSRLTTPATSDEPGSPGARPRPR
ncbi:hypothetical protein [Serinicoccus profundi]|uniref:hypothetical protein n=1 Tax=Serinicoccus profundi TaxID=1078471 RepID=UPI000304D08C|nr:hypothetical protein [Serinicoccus profundi]